MYVLRSCNVVTLRSLCVCTAFLHRTSAYRFPRCSSPLSSVSPSYPTLARFVTSSSASISSSLSPPSHPLPKVGCRIYFKSNLEGNSKVEDARTRKTQGTEGRSEEKRRVFFFLPMNKGVPIRERAMVLEKGTNACRC